MADPVFSAAVYAAVSAAGVSADVKRAPFGSRFSLLLCMGKFVLAHLEPTMVTKLKGLCRLRVSVSVLRGERRWQASQWSRLSCTFASTI